MRVPPLLALTALAIQASAAEFPGLRLADGFRPSVFATSNQVGNAVAICFDPAGRLYSVEANRRITGTWGVTMSRWWSMEDYGNTSLEDRTAMYDRWAHIVPAAKLTRDADILRRIVDTNGDGQADNSLILDRFNGPLEGNAAGVLAWADQLYVANAPTLWRGPLEAPGERKALQTGLGVRVGVYGHDLHGLIPGPDGRLYFSLGDRGFHLVTAEGRRLSSPRRGAVFRCFPDGTGLELYHVGLRNPQDLAFNELGDLFTVDNDMGGVDKSRVVHVIEGGDSGWDATYQLTRNFREETARADHPEPPWFTEQLWETRHDGQPAWLHPPIAHLTQGPSGMEFDPGWGLPERLRGAMFVCDFKGTSSRSGIYTFHLEATGAGWRVSDTNQFAWGLLPADIEFGYDGCLYVADWIGGWGGSGQRRIVRLEHGTTANSAAAREVRTLMAGDWADRPRESLAELLRHFDRRVRHAAQSELARRHDAETFQFIAKLPGASLTTRLHGVHGLWQIGLRRRLATTEIAGLESLLDDPLAELRAQAAKVLGEIGARRHAGRLQSLLSDASPRVRYFAAIGLGRLGQPEHATALVDLLRRESDPVTRHGGVLALGRLATGPQLARMATDASPAARLAAVLALRHRAAPQLADFLEDPDRSVRMEAIRALHDLAPSGAMDALARHATTSAMADERLPFPVRHRLLNARFRRGSEEDAAFLGRLAADPGQSLEMRREALDALEHWEFPSPFDRVTWHHRPIDDGPRVSVMRAIESGLLTILREPSPAGLLPPAARLANRLQVGDETQITAVVLEQRLEPSIRTAVFDSLMQRQPASKKDICRQLLNDHDTSLRIRAAEQLYPAPDAIRVLDTLWNAKSVDSRRLLLSRTHLMRQAWGIGRLKEALSADAKGTVDALSLDLLLAAETSGDSSVQTMAASRRESLNNPASPLGQYRLALAGGDPTAGKRLFATHAVQCVRCHVIKGFGGDAGPELTRIGRSLKREELVLALIDPSARIAPGFGTFEFELADGSELAGFVEREDANRVVLMTMDGRRQIIPANTIRHRSQPASAMPSMRELLSLGEIRDLAAYLSSLR